MRVAIDPQKRYRHLKNKVNWAVCDKCGWNWPETMLKVHPGPHGGVKICPNHSTFRETTEEKDLRLEKASARLARLREPIPKWPHAMEMQGLAAIYDIRSVTTGEKPPFILKLSSGHFGFTLTGVYLSLTDSVVLSPAEGTILVFDAFPFNPILTAIDSETHGNRVTYFVTTAGLAIRGDVDLIYNGDVFKNVFQVR